MEAEFISASYWAVKVFAWLEIKKTFDNSFILFCDYSKSTCRDQQNLFDMQHVKAKVFLQKTFVRWRETFLWWGEEEERFKKRDFDEYSEKELYLGGEGKSFFFFYVCVMDEKIL